MKYKFLFQIALGACLALLILWVCAKAQDLHTEYYTETEICDVISRTDPIGGYCRILSRSHGFFEATPEQCASITRKEGHACYHQITFYGWDTLFSTRKVSEVKFNRCRRQHFRRSGRWAQ